MMYGTDESVSQESVVEFEERELPAPPQQSLRTLADVRAQVAGELAVRTVTKAETLDGKP